MIDAPLTAWIFAFWIATAVLAAPLAIGAALGSRWAHAQRRIVRAALATAPAILIAGVLLPDPFGGRPLLLFESTEVRNAVPTDDSEPLPFAEPPMGIVDQGARNFAATSAVASAVASATGVGEDSRLDAPEANPQGEGIAGRTPDAPAGAVVGPVVEPAPSAEQKSAERRARRERLAEIRRGLASRAPAAEPFGPPPLPDLTPIVASVTGARSVPPGRVRAPRRSLAASDALEPIRHPTAARPPARPPVRRSGSADGESALPPVRSATPAPPSAASDSGVTGESTLALALRLLLFAWAVGALLGLIRIVRSVGRLARLRATATAVSSTRGVPLHPLSPELPVRIIPGLGSAAAVGITRPEIWLPAHWSAQLDRANLHALLSHESAHHIGRDPLWRVIAALVVSLLWPHPLVHSLRRREETLSELVADRRVLASGAGPRRYAGLLADLAAQVSGRAMPLAAGVLGTRSPLERRIRMILSTSPDRAARDGGWVAPALLGSLLVTALGISVCFPIVGEACDPEDECKPPIEFVLESKNGVWTASGGAEKGDTLKGWSIVLAPESVGPAQVLTRLDGGRAVIQVGANQYLIDTAVGALVEARAPRIQVRDGDKLGLADLLLTDDDEPQKRKEGEDLLRLRLAELEAREADLRAQEAALSALHEELSRRESEHNDHQRMLEIRVDEELHAMERDMDMARHDLRLAEIEMRKRPDDPDLHRDLARRSAELAKREAEMRAQHAMRIAELTARVTDERLNMQEQAYTELTDRSAQIAMLRAQLEAHRQQLANEHESQARGKFERGEYESARRDYERARELEYIQRNRGDGHDHDHGHDDLLHDGDDHGGDHRRDHGDELDFDFDFDFDHKEIAEAIAEAMRELHEAHGELSEEVLEEAMEEAQDAMEEFHEMFEELHEGMEEMHEAFEVLEDLPELLEGLEMLEELPEMLEDLHKESSSDGRRARKFESMIAELSEALDRSRVENANLQAENSELKSELKRLKKKKNAGGGLR